MNIPEFPQPKKASENEHQWATYISDRIPKFKVHRTMGQAHSACTYRRSWRSYVKKMSADVVLYKKTGTGEWEPQHSWEAGEQVNYFPWQAPEPTPEEQRQAAGLRRVDINLASAIFEAKRLVSGDLQGKIVTELESTRSRIAKLIRDS